MKKIVFIISLFILFILPALFLPGHSLAQDTINEKINEEINEEELFSSPESIMATEKIVDNTFPEEEKKTLGLSGKAESVIDYRKKIPLENPQVLL